MDEKKRNRQGEPADEQRSNAPSEQQSDTQNVSNEQETNEQEEASGENFYQNRERGNYEPGRTPDEGGGGSLY